MKTDQATKTTAASSRLDRGVGRQDPKRAVARVLMPDYWLHSLQTRTGYTRRQDDTDGSLALDQNITVSIGPDGDCWVVAGGGRMLRFRTWGGGGMSLRTRQALLVLAEAIRLDNEELPQIATKTPNAELTGASEVGSRSTGA